MLQHHSQQNRTQVCRRKRERVFGNANASIIHNSCAKVEKRNDHDRVWELVCVCVLGPFVFTGLVSELCLDKGILKRLCLCITISRYFEYALVYDSICFVFSF